LSSFIASLQPSTRADRWMRWLAGSGIKIGSRPFTIG
jgi:hypothetical protein